jgi:hypothetical protein
MADGLDGARARIERAKEHLADLAALADAFLERGACDLTSHTDQETGRVSIRAKAREHPPPRIGIILGDCVHSLRSALEYVAWQLVLANDNTPTNETGFPVLPKRPKSDEALRQHVKVMGMAADAIDWIAGMQPYTLLDHSPPGDPALHWLALLHQLDIEDKHHAVNLTLVSIGFPSLAVAGDEGEWPPTNRATFRDLTFPDHPKVLPLHQEVEVLAFAVEDATSDIDVGVPFHVAFDPAGAGRGEPLFPLIQDLVNTVDQAVESFANFV